MGGACGTATCTAPGGGNDGTDCVARVATTLSEAYCTRSDPFDSTSVDGVCTVVIGGATSTETETGCCGAGGADCLSTGGADTNTWTANCDWSGVATWTSGV